MQPIMEVVGRVANQAAYGRRNPGVLEAVVERLIRDLPNHPPNPDAEMRPLDAERDQPQAAEAAPQAQLRPQDAGQYRNKYASMIPWAAALIGIILAFILGAAFGPGESAHLNTLVAYFRLHLFNRGAAHDLQLWANAAGLPLNIAQPGEFSNIIGTFMAAAFAWRRFRGGQAV